MNIPRATVRLQLHKGFTFDDAAAVVDYYAALGISHFYTSPILTAQPGSGHGYDIIDPSAINPELGGEAGLWRLRDRLDAHGMGLIVDIVPNHMGVGSANRWWQDVLEWGRDSDYARWFDINWEARDPDIRGKVLAPFLGEQYGRILRSGELKLQFDAETGKIVVAYHTHRFPLAPDTYGAILKQGDAPVLREASMAFARIVRPPVTLQPSAGAREEAQRLAQEAFALLTQAGQDAAGRAALETALAHFSGADPLGVGALHGLLERQHYRLSWWRCAADQINWRRFFEVSTLAGIRVERDEVFEAMHSLIFRLYRQGLIDGVRVDHVDGLAEPGAYCRKLVGALRSLALEHRRAPPYVVVEKILAPGERLHADWQVDGSTGYDFMDQVGALLHDGDGAVPLTVLWQEATAGQDFAAEARAARRQLLAENLTGEFDAAARTLLQMARADVASRDFSLTAIRRVLTELLVQFPVYRSYGGVDGRDEADQAVFERALGAARRNLRSADHALLDAIDGWLDADPDPQDDEARRTLRKRAITRFQQLTPPLSAKSIEDTAFYRYGRLVSRNEVGSDPGQLALPPEQFHALCGARAREFPRAMLATATHDHKRGEDVRARLAVLSEMPGQWRQLARRWMTRHAPLRATVAADSGGAPMPAPSAADELALYQMLAGAWPLALAPGDAAGVADFVARIAEWQAKALREAKQVSDWIEPNDSYEAGCRAFLQTITGSSAEAAEFLAELAGWVDTVAAAGAVNGLTQTLLRLTCPGVPDLYQGCELWDLSLVDPDNRRAVDYDARRQALQHAGTMQARLADWRSGALKQALIARALALRSQAAQLFADGDYVPLEVSGPRAAHVIAYARTHGEHAVVVLVCRLVAGLCERDRPVIDPAQWQGTCVRLPAGFEGGWHDHLGGGAGQASDGVLMLAQVLAGLPLALLEMRRTLAPA